MDKRSDRRFTAKEKRTILDETQQPGVTLAEVCRKHSVNPGLVRVEAIKAFARRYPKTGQKYGNFQANGVFFCCIPFWPACRPARGEPGLRKHR